MGIQAALAVAGRAFGDPLLGVGVRRCAAAGGRTFSLVERYDRVLGSQKGGIVGGLSPRVARPYRVSLAGLLGCARISVVALLWPCAAGWCPTAEDCLQCLATASVGSGVRARRCRWVSGVLSAPCPTRLETRTKESNMCASQRVLRNPRAK